MNLHRKTASILTSLKITLMALFFPIVCYGAGATEAEFYDAGRIFEQANATELAANSITLKMDFRTNTLQASYTQNPNVITVVTDGAATNPIFTPVLTRDAYIMILCHEFGHGVGGLAVSGSLQTSIEGQADYFASNSCMQKIFNDSVSNLNFVKDNAIDDELKIWCGRFITDTKKQAQCLRIGMAALSLTHSNVLAAKSTHFPKISTPDCSQNVLIHSFGPTIKSRHPNNQCRLDTFMRGLVGEKPPPCWYSLESTENKNFFETMDRIYAEPNVCQRVCKSLPAGVSEREREQRCLSAPCTRMMFGFLSPGKNYDIVDNDYHKTVLVQVGKIVAADDTFRKDCANKYIDKVTLEALLENSSNTKVLCPPTPANSSPWKGPYIEASIVKPIIDGKKVWCTPPKLGNDCASDAIFERMLKNCGK